MLIIMKRHKKKVNKMRGWRTHGGGFSKKRRGSGSRMTHHRTYTTNIAHVRKYEPERLSQRGFVSRFARIKAINLDDVDKKSGGMNEVDARNYKILGGGNITRPIKIKAHSFSKKALEKIKKAKGEAVCLTRVEKQSEIKEE